MYTVQWGAWEEVPVKDLVTTQIKDQHNRAKPVTTWFPCLPKHVHI